jgi:hypothetical protein
MTMRRSSNPTLNWIKRNPLFLSVPCFIVSLIVGDRWLIYITGAWVVASAVATVMRHRRNGGVWIG